MRYALGLIGGGNMAEAIVRAAVTQGVVPAGSIIVADPVPARRALFEPLGVAVTESNAAAAVADQLMLAIKPQMLEKIAADLTGITRTKQVVLSIMAGVRIAKIERVLGGPARVIRIMPNTPMLAGAGMSAIAIGPNAEPGDEQLAMKLFRAAGEAITVDESLMDAVTAVSGSGPAYVFYLAEAMTAAALKLGLPADDAALLVRQTILGSAKLMSESPDPPAELRRKVTSPGGTTQAACEHLDATQIRAHIADAVAKAAERSKQLGS